MEDTGVKFLAECNPDDLFWGSGVKLYSPLALNPDQWSGRNILGRTLMTICSQLAEAKQED